MRKLCCILLVFVLFSACAQTPDDVDPGPALISTPVKAPKAIYRYRFEVDARTIGYTLLINGAEMYVFEGGNGKVSTYSTVINDWMISGNNEIAVNIFWPDGLKFTPGAGSGVFRFFVNDTQIKEYRWPVAEVPEDTNSYTINDTFRADGFPRVLIERAERVISSTGALPQSDQEEIAALAEQVRQAFTENDISRIGSLFEFKYADLAAARFITAAAVRAEMDAQFLEVMEKEAYAVRPFSYYGRYGYFSTADDRVVRLVQGRIGFPEPVLVITYRNEARRTARYDLDLYFVKIDGKWIIIR
ncbi:MAG: hypothetical protein LBK74_03810 [Treponema sp.]|nr:hypothetical protein [Treponema sp.]